MDAEVSGGPRAQLATAEAEPRVGSGSDEIREITPDQIRQMTENLREALPRVVANAMIRRGNRSGYRINQAHVRLDPASRRRLNAIGSELLALYATFEGNVAAEESAYLLMESEADLVGLGPSQIAAAATAAAQQGHAGRWAIFNTLSAVGPFLSRSERRDLRERVWRAFVNRGDHDGFRDNKPIATQILRLRAERAELLGYPTPAHWQLNGSMAQTPDRALEFLGTLWEPAVAQARLELVAMQAIADRDGAGVMIEPWDCAYYATRVLRDRLSFDFEDVRPYLRLDQIREAMFWVAGQLLGLKFAPAPDEEVDHPDVQAWRVTNRNGAEAGLWLFDPDARPDKKLLGWRRVFTKTGPAFATNTANLLKAPAGQTLLLSWAEATNLFHQFGHALQGLCSSDNRASLLPSSLAVDYEDFPARLFERWLLTPEVLTRFARHVTTGQPLPATMVEKLQQAARLNQGIATTEILASAQLDMRAHLAGIAPIDIAAFERDTLRGLAMPSAVVPRSRMPNFSHIFGHDNLSAGFYGYLWADMLVADAYDVFAEGGGPFDQEVAERLQAHVFSAGGTRDPAEAYRALSGREATVDALLRQRGFPSPTSRHRS